MIKQLFSAALLFVICCMAYGEAQGGPIAKALYSNSMYGLTHPLTNEFSLPVNYALSESEVKKRQFWDAAIGTGFNLAVPGLGSLIIGDPNSLGMFLGFVGSMTLVGLGWAFEIGGGFSGNQNQILTGGILLCGGFAFAIGFEVWGVISPIRFVNTDQYLERIRRR